MASAKSVTLRDVAAIVGVSVATVSKVLNGRGRVSDETRVRIFEAAERLEFRPNALAQFFATGKSHTVALLAQKATGTFSMPVILGITSRMAREDIAVVVYDAVEDDVSGRPENIKKLRARQIDGIIVVGDGNDRVFPSISSSVGVPVVYAFGASDSAKDVSFTPDDLMAGRLAAQHLVDTGRRSIAVVTGSAQSQAVQDRLQGVTETLAAHGKQIAGDGPIHGNWTRSFGREAGLRLLESGVPMDAIICGNDFIAMGVREVLLSSGVRIPEDVAIVGHDSWEQYIGDRPFFTSVNPRLNNLGQTAAESLINACYHGGEDEGAFRLTCELTVGQSS